MAQDPVAPRPDAEERRPTALLLVFTWDLVLSVGLVLLAFAVFAGSRERGGQTVPIPIAVQIFQALAYAALATALFLVGTMLTRRLRWVRRAQIVILAMHMVLLAASLSVQLLTDESSRSLGIVLGAAVIILLDALAMLAMTERRVVVWFDEPGEVPFYVGALIAFWAATSTAFFVTGLVTQ